MEDLEDELDLRFHKGLIPEVYYRLIPTEIITEIVFSAASTITIPVTYQPDLDALIEPADFLQSITVECALCRDIDRKERLKVQRAIARSIIEAIQDADGFRYAERRAVNKEGGDGARFKYICLDSFQNKYRKSNMKKEESPVDGDGEEQQKGKEHTRLATYDCGGAIHIKFSIKREAVNVVYKHNPIHSRPVNGDSNLPSLVTGNDPAPSIPTPAESKGATKPKRKRSKKEQVNVNDEFTDPDLNMSTSPEAPKSSTKKKRKKDGPISPESSQKPPKKKGKKAQEPQSPSKPRKAKESPLPPGSIIGKACIRCREKKIMCNEAKPTCNQCRRGLWTCQYEVLGGKKRSKNGCLNCKQRKRKSLPSDSTTSKRAIGTWDDAYTKATAALAKLSQNDKIGIVTGVGWQGGNCVGNTKAASSIGYPSLCLQDGPLGVRYIQGATAFSAGIHAASTWDIDLVRERGAFLGAESKQLGVHVQLGPCAGPLGKNAQGGRNWEGFGADPYLQGIMMAQTIEGMQDSGVQATAKHFILNEQELNRETMSSDIPDRVLRELYVWPFMDAIKSNVAAFMCSYNKINGTWACENDGIMNKLLKDELGFRGYIMSDWNAQHSTLGSANGGLDMTMPGTDFDKKNAYWGSALQSAISNRQVDQSRLDDMVKRVLAAWYLVGQDKGYPTATFNSWKIGSHDVGGTHRTNVRAMARDGIVLLKNTGAALPLNKPKSIAVIGLDSIVAPKGANACADRGCDDGTLAVGWGSGSVEFPYLIAPLDAIKTQAQKDGTTITSSPNDNAQQGASAAQNADIAVVCVNSDGGEGYITVEGSAGDRKNLNLWHNGDDLVKAVAAVNKKTVVVVHSVGPVILESWIDNPNVVAVVWAGLPGQESGNGLVDILYGATSPSGKLPYTIAKKAEDYGTKIASGTDSSWDLFVDYRHFDKQNIEPRFEFGFGLSYTNFTYSDLAVTGTPTAGPATGAKGPGGPADLWETVATVTAKVANSGGVAGAEVPQLYLGYPAAANVAPKQLRGFAKLKLEAGASATATFKLRRRDLSIWDEKTRGWSVVSGEYGVFVGSSSRDVRLTGKITV
ncbi:glycoside hydrolase 3 [Neocucurbitaria cava]|uniref:beta-glucosidase n=1 Tax=Neocucurbitaria cava TaxID=798079 RepID=A0A9W8XZX2_9PLEO|nr:glycoside hydrolase 3 [Neocucurbitaria cava]